VCGCAIRPTTPKLDNRFRARRIDFALFEFFGFFLALDAVVLSIDHYRAVLVN
jgi:hypothetical protein